MPTSDSCPTCHRLYVRRSSLQEPAGPCPSCRSKARQERYRKERYIAGICVTCGKRSAKDGARNCEECIQARTKRGKSTNAKAPARA